MVLGPPARVGDGFVEEMEIYSCGCYSYCQSDETQLMTRLHFSQTPSLAVAAVAEAAAVGI